MNNHNSQLWKTTILNQKTHTISMAIFHSYVIAITGGYINHMQRWSIDYPYTNHIIANHRWSIEYTYQRVVVVAASAGDRWQQFCWTQLAALPFSCAPSGMHDIAVVPWSFEQRRFEPQRGISNHVNSKNLRIECRNAQKEFKILSTNFTWFNQQRFWLHSNQQAHGDITRNKVTGIVAGAWLDCEQRAGAHFCFSRSRDLTRLVVEILVHLV